MRYICDGFRSIDGRDVLDVAEAAEIFAGRQARREFGRTGYCRTIRRDSRTLDGSTVTYEAYIGVRSPYDQNTTIGKNVWLVVHRQPA